MGSDVSVRCPLGLKYINKEKQHDPHHIDKVPVPATGLKRKVVMLGKMPFKYPEQQDKQDQGI